ncbi:hypothetical protein GGS21DRAFT_330916 [Xylaria nigripes]|nr:hypothetical protein GGS21DRAFT_330916 [Xylaria nigripes]
MSTASVLAQLKPFTLGTRSLFVKCVPAPTTFYERRAVLAALQKSSQKSIEIFRKLQDGTSFIAVTTNPDAAKSLVKSSPLQETIVSQDPAIPGDLAGAAWNSNFMVEGTITNPVRLLSADAAEPTPAYNNLGLSSKTFTLHIFPTNTDYDHIEENRKSPINGQWPGADRGDTFVSAALRRVIPSGAMAPALRDWETSNQLAHDADAFADNGREGAAATLLQKKRLTSQYIFIMERMRRRLTQGQTPEVMESLVQFAEKYRSNVELPKTQPETSDVTATEAPNLPRSEVNASEPNALSKNTAPNTSTNTQYPNADEWPSAKLKDKKSDTIIDDATFKSMFDD